MCEVPDTNPLRADGNPRRVFVSQQLGAFAISNKQWLAKSIAERMMLVRLMLVLSAHRGAFIDSFSCRGPQ
jgi:hypothetical protein